MNRTRFIRQDRSPRWSPWCAACNGRGWIQNALAATSDVWPVTCARCGGLGALGGTMTLAKSLGVHRRDVLAVRTMRAGKKVGMRVLDAIASRFPEALVE